MNNSSFRSALKPFLAFCTLNTLVYCFPAKWIWGPNGWLKNLGVIDNAGSGVVHLVAGFAG